MRQLLILFLSVFVLFSCNKDATLTETTENITQKTEKGGDGIKGEGDGTGIVIVNNDEKESDIRFFLQDIVALSFSYQRLGYTNLPTELKSENLKGLSNDEVLTRLENSFEYYPERETVYNDLVRLGGDYYELLQKYPELVNYTQEQWLNTVEGDMELVDYVRYKTRFIDSCDPLREWREDFEPNPLNPLELVSEVYVNNLILEENCGEKSALCYKNFQTCWKDATSGLLIDILSCIGDAAFYSGVSVAILTSTTVGVGAPVATVIGIHQGILYSAICVDMIRDSINGTKCDNCVEKLQICCF